MSNEEQLTDPGTPDPELMRLYHGLRAKEPWAHERLNDLVQEVVPSVRMFGAHVTHSVVAQVSYESIRKAVEEGKFGPERFHSTGQLRKYVRNYLENRKKDVVRKDGNQGIQGIPKKVRQGGGVVPEPLTGAPVEARGATPVEQAAGSEVNEAIVTAYRRAEARAKPDDLKAFRLVAFRNCTLAEAAAKLGGIAESTVLRRRARVCVLIREEWISVLQSWGRNVTGADPNSGDDEETIELVRSAQHSRGIPQDAATRTMTQLLGGAT